MRSSRRVRAVLYAATHDEARRLLDALVAERSRFKNIGKYDTIRTLQPNFDVYTGSSPHIWSARRPNPLDARRVVTKAFPEPRNRGCWVSVCA